MRRPHTELYVHLVWTTWKRAPILIPDLEAKVYAAFRAKCDELRCDLVAAGGVEDHVHVLVGFPAALSVAVLVQHLKGSTSHLVTHVLKPDSFFKWQGAYGAFTVGSAGLNVVRDYVLRQKQHHAKADLNRLLESTDLPG